jgi:hypothetical protein
MCVIQYAMLFMKRNNIWTRMLRKGTDEQWIEIIILR